MTARIQENFPLQPLDIFSHPTQNDYERAKDKARQLLREVLPEDAWSEFKDKGVIYVAGRRGEYVISSYSQTEIRDIFSSRLVAYACLQLSIPAPSYDRMVAEYLLIKNTEDVYWETSNIFPCKEKEFGIITLFLIAFDIVLFVNLLLEIFGDNQGRFTVF